MDYHKTLDETQDEIKDAKEPLLTHLKVLESTLETLIDYENKIFRKDLRVNGPKKGKK